MAQTKSTVGMSKKPIAKVWTFESSSGSATYETLQYTDGTTSCNCRGWAIKKKGTDYRTCKHTRMVDQGIADDYCISCKNYAEVKQPSQVSSPVKEKKVKKVQTNAPEQKVAPRRIQW